MGIRVPRITVNADFGDDTAFGDLSLLSVGYGLHQAWVYAIGLHYGPFPIAGILAGIIPLLELAILWNKTPAPYSERNEVPIFKPLPVNHAKFFLRFGIPVFVFGVALGTLRQTSIQYIVPASNVGDQIAMLLAAGFASVVILVTIVALGGGDKWSRYFRPLVPFIAVTLFFLPLSEMSDNTFATMFLVMGYLCFEALMWIFFGELAQRFRLSPIYVFGLGRGMLALAGLAGSLFPIVAANWVHLLPFGEQGVIVIVLLIMVVAYALLPREREIEAIVAPCPLVKAVSLELSDRVRPLGQAGSAGEGAAAAAQSGNNATAATNAPAPDAEIAPEPEPTARRAPSLLELSSARRADEGEERKGGGRFRAKCETVANTYLLSRRETEIMFFLAKGHNAAYIQEKLYISEGTAKTHIRHVYKKTNVHSQQELMRLVELADPAE